MASKKFTLLVVLMVCVASVGFGQLGGTLDYLDSSKIKSRKLPQYNEWKSASKMNPFPPAPRHMGQLGIYGGMMLVDGDCPPLPGFNVGASYRKALGYVVSARVSFAYGQAKGLDYRKNPNLKNHPVLSVYETPSQANPNAAGPGWYVHNFKTTIYNPAVDLLFSLNNIMFHRKSNKVNVYALIGYAPVAYKTEMDLLNGSRPYSYASATSDPNFFYRPRKEIRDDMKEIFDGDYETSAIVNDRSNNFDDGDPKKTQWRHTFNTGFGLEFRIAPRASISTEFKYQWLRDDYFDGWFMNSNNATTGDKDNMLFTNISFNFNL